MEAHNIGALIVTDIILVVPYHIYSIRCPKTLFLLLRPLHYPKHPKLQ